jgi:hypothetical protein
MPLDGARPLYDTEWREDALPALRRIFDSDDPFRPQINSSLEGRALLFPVSYCLTEAQLKALGQAASTTTGDNGFFYTPTEGETVSLQVRRPDGRGSAMLDPAIMNLARQWWIPFDDWESYADTGPHTDNALFSAAGAWGVLVSHEDHAVVAGSAAFVDALLQSWPAYTEPGGHPVTARQGAAAFVNELLCLRGSDVRDHAMRTWLPSLLVHVYGREEAARLLALG